MEIEIVEGSCRKSVPAERPKNLESSPQIQGILSQRGTKKRYHYPNPKVSTKLIFPFEKPLKDFFSSILKIPFCKDFLTRGMASIFLLNENKRTAFLLQTPKGISKKGMYRDLHGAFLTDMKLLFQYTKCLEFLESKTSL